jgi:hypothetical protein
LDYQFLVRESVLAISFPFLYALWVVETELISPRRDPTARHFFSTALCPVVEDRIAVDFLKLWRLRMLLNRMAASFYNLLMVPFQIIAVDLRNMTDKQADHIFLDRMTSMIQSYGKNG